jgi:UPF0176 protein
VNTVLNISAYKFVPLPDAAALRERLHARATARALKGTILLAEEGINLFLAGEAGAVRGFVGQLHTDPRFADIAPKESWSASQPFKKMLVKVKGEIIRMNHPAIQPALGRAPAVAPATVKRWLDQGFDDNGRPVVTLDTRNRLAHHQIHRVSRRAEQPFGRLERQDRRELLHGRHSL